MKKAIILFLLPLAFISCESGEKEADAYGNFEAREIMVSAEAMGKLLDFTVDEGAKVRVGKQMGLIDTVQLYLKKQQLVSTIAALKSKVQNVKVQVEVLTRQKQNMVREYKRLESLFKDDAATQKQLDDVKGEIDVVDSRIVAIRSQMNTANQGLLSEIAPLEAQMNLINDQLSKCNISTPIDGVVLTTYVEAGEFVTIGKPLFKVANLENMELKVYLSGDQLVDFKLGDEVEVLVDKDKESNRSLTGKVTWISSQAEFTPKIIQTKAERVNLVYAVKILTVNDGSLKIGMPGEVKFKN